MLNWIEEFKPINKRMEQIHHRRFNLKKVSFESPSSMTELARFVSAGSVLLEDNILKAPRLSFTEAFRSSVSEQDERLLLP
jgi:hypothetical protein